VRNRKNVALGYDGGKISAGTVVFFFSDKPTISTPGTEMSHCRPVGHRYVSQSLRHLFSTAPNYSSSRRRKEDGRDEEEDM